MMGEGGRILYIGKAKNLKNRVSNYTIITQLPYRLARMVGQVTQVEYIITQSEVEALLLEARMIKEHKPPYNILLKDDKSFPYICIDETHDFPRIYKYRGAKKKNASYFGPYPSALTVKEAIAAIQKAFLLRPCKDSYFKNRSRPCIEYDIKRCSAPCVEYVSKVDYKKLVTQGKDFLSGKSDEIKLSLQAEMQKASDEMEYEKAATFRNRIATLVKIQSKQHIHTKLEDADVIAIYNSTGKVCIQVFFVRGGKVLGNAEYFPRHTEEISNAEILQFFLISFYQEKPMPKNIILSEETAESEDTVAALRELSGINVEISVPKQHGEKLKLVEMALNNANQSIERKVAEEESSGVILKKIQKLFNIKEEIRRIEVFDNSHIFGANAIGAMIVAGFDEENKWVFLKKYYRKFNVDAGGKKTGGDDFYMMHQVLTRRYKRMMEENEKFPELILIDGGKGQQSVAFEVFRELGILDKVNFVCIAKGEDRNSGREDFYLQDERVFKLPVNDSALFFLQNLRDEAHRFAITGHRAKRKKSLTTSVLDEIPDIGKVRKKALLNYFGSARNVEDATIEDLCRVEGISKTLAEQIYNFSREK